MMPLPFRQLLRQWFFFAWSLSICRFRPTHSYLVSSSLSHIRISPRLSMSGDGEEDTFKFGFKQRIESVKCAVVGGLAGSVALAPVSFLHSFVLLPPANPLSQWEFDTDMASLEAALFAIVYRYCVRLDTNPQLASGCVGAFAVVRTLARIETPAYCSAIPLDCTSAIIAMRKHRTRSELPSQFDISIVAALSLLVSIVLSLQVAVRLATSTGP